MKIKEVHDVEALRPILAYREAHNVAADFGVETSLEHAIGDLQVVDTLFPRGMFVCYDGDEVVGCLVVHAAQNFFGPQRIAIVRYWYTNQTTRTAGPRLMAAGLHWAKQQGCSHLMSMATEFFDEPKSDKVARFYEHLGMRLMERVYIREVQ